MSRIRAIVVDPAAHGRLELDEVDAPVPLPGEALVRVAATSLNRGELRRAVGAEAGWRPGWDLAGTVEACAADGAGPPVGARVVGVLGSSGAWAEVVAVPTQNLAVLPDAVSFAQAATLPVAGLTALRTLARGGLLLGEAVLVTGASGGVGHFMCQIAQQAGALVVAAVSRQEQATAVREDGAHEVVFGEDLAGAEAFAPYHHIVDSIGGRTLPAALKLLAPDGECVMFGTTAAPDIAFDGRGFYLIGGARLYGFILFHELERQPGAADLGRLARLVADGRLRPRIDLEAPWTEIASVSQRLLDRQISGKAVLHFTG
ncbi:MAG TPA: zinc-binding dehydrogenase [Ktedonobacterales bacterium]|nr:zinc-binding dehydrogenase [Ktedonobacterales bacterium]